MRIKNRIRLLILYLLLGLLCGGLGTLFSKGVTLVTEFRRDHGWLLYLLPLAGILSVSVYRLLRVNGMGTNQVIASAGGRNVLSPRLAPAIFLGSLLSHLCGASVGREGAALQLGGSAATLLSKWFGLDHREDRVLVYCGMAGLFSSVFGTPLAAAVFALEVVFVGRIHLGAVLPVAVTSFLSFGTAHLLGAHAERFTLSAVPAPAFSVLWKVVLLGALLAGVGFLFCLCLEHAEKLFERLFKNPFLRIAVGGAVLVLLTLAVDTYDYNGAGVHVIEEIFAHGRFVPAAFLLKLVFTCVAVGGGFKGGEIVPTLFIGATFGALAGSLLGLPVPFSAAVGMTALFCAVTNCPLASVLLAAELFSARGLGYCAAAVAVSFVLSGRISLYSAQQVRGFKALF